MKHLSHVQLDCCGVIEITGFYENQDEYDDLIPIKEARADLRILDARIAGMALILLNQDQQPTFDEMLKEEGYKLVAEEMNRNSGNTIYMYVKIRSDVVKPVKKTAKLKSLTTAKAKLTKTT